MGTASPASMWLWAVRFSLMGPRAGGTSELCVLALLLPRLSHLINYSLPTFLPEVINEISYTTAMVVNIVI